MGRTRPGAGTCTSALARGVLGLASGSTVALTSFLSGAPKQDTRPGFQGSIEIYLGVLGALQWAGRQDATSRGE